jgi:AbrB family looped-hinge helix DNA binding protein
MKSRVIIDKAGRITIPKPLRKELHLGPGDTLEVESGNERLLFRLSRTASTLTKEHGVGVLHTGQPLSATLTDAVLQQIREERESANLVIRE